MKILISHKISAIIMASLVLLSSTGFSMAVHFCQGNIVGISLTGEPVGCCNKQTHSTRLNAIDTCEDKANSIDKKDKCCQNKNLVINKVDIDAPVLQLPGFKDIHFDAWATSFQAWHLNTPVKKHIQAYQLYHPPIPDKDMQVLYKTFLI